MTSEPPGLVTRRNSWSASLVPTTFRSPKDIVTASKDSSAKGSLNASAAVKARSGRRRLPTRSIPREKSAGTTLAPALAKGSLLVPVPAAISSTVSPLLAPTVSRTNRRQRLSWPRDSTSLVRSYFAATSSNIAATSLGCLSRLARVMVSSSLMTQLLAPAAGHAPLCAAAVVGLTVVTSLPQSEPTRAKSPAAHVPTLVARMVTIDDPGDLLSLIPQALDPEQVSSWVRHGEGLVGWGRALGFRASGRGRFTQAQAWWRSVVEHAVVRDDVHLPGTGPVAFGSFSFSADSPAGAMLVVPQVLVGQRGSRWWMTCLLYTS